MNYESSPNSVQFGGDHYHRAGHNQHWDMLYQLGYGWEYYLARASAYMTRVKDPELDPSKAGHFLDKLVWMIDNGLVPATFAPSRPPRVDIERYLKDTYFPANGIDPLSLEARAIRAIHSAYTREGLRTARDICSQIEAGVSARPDTPVHKARPDPATTLNPMAPWPFGDATGRGYVDQDADRDKSPTPQAFSSGGGGDFGGGGATASWGEPKPADEPRQDNRMFSFGDDAIAASTDRPVESCSRSSYDTSSDSSSSSSSDSSSGGGGGSD